MKVAFHQFLPIGCLEEKPQVSKSGIYSTFTVAIKNGRQNRLKIEKLQFWTKFKALGDRKIAP